MKDYYNLLGNFQSLEELPSCKLCSGLTEIAIIFTPKYTY